MSCPVCDAEEERNCAGFVCGTYEIVPTSCLIGKVDRRWFVSERCIVQSQAHIKELEGLVREMGSCVQVAANAEQHGGADDNHYVFRKFGMKSIAQDILNRPEVRAIWGEGGK